ncbi:diacylglycerol/lipid kinase family protein [Mobiluncus porci]|uniref:Diacylglycerol kinase n=1 Tax=Mobiluncus porci TaxID=2652278 RepID=A0A7K0K5H8_9ACTO|nr:diacylglycerol kinase family protein [Mobiluncus porci]MST50699.1 diacylglycerol kinase [Mobiluncus porci]
MSDATAEESTPEKQPDPYEGRHFEIHRLAFITNPTANKGGALKNARKARKVLGSRGIELVEYPSESALDAKNAASDAVKDPTIDAVAICGGDGIVSLVLQHLVGSGKPLGVIPAGTGNDHARNLGIPLQPKKAAAVIADGFARPTDLGLATFTDLRGKKRKRWWSTVTCVGFDQMVNDRTQEISWPHGSARYMVALFQILSRFHPYPSQVILDGIPLEAERLTLCAVGNGRFYGGGVEVAPRGSSFDGKFSITTLSSMNKFQMVRALLRAKTGRFEGAPGVEFHEATKVSLEMESLAPIADGERLGYGQVSLECKPAAGLFILPEDTSGKA